jgi:predicted DCC family thiol-disulfide oxidoreductase YuxK
MPEASLPADLPTPSQRPDTDIVIFDGKCRFCTAQVQRLARWDKGRRLAFLSLHDPEVARRWPQLSHQQLMEEMYVVDRSGNCFGGAAALRHLSRRIVRLWPLVPLLHLPGTLPLWQIVYRWIARRRYKLQGQTACQDDGTCRVHQGRQADRS